MLEEQRHLLRKSINDVAAGDLVEAVRIAAIIRVLVHETGSSKPLLKQLTSNYLELAILDGREPHAARDHMVLRFPVSMKLSPESVSFNPDLDTAGAALSILGKWWETPCLILPGLGGFSRRELVLGLANKEGGAHVDPNVSKRYQQLMGYKSIQMGPQHALSPLNVSRLMVAQAGVELLDCIERKFPRAATAGNGP